MPDIKEKLVELIRHCTSCEECFDTDIADHLIANGVTIQKWISVEERLPEPFVNVLIHCPECDPLYPVHEGYVLNDAGAWADAQGCEIEGVTHWMTLPEPPAEEEHHE